MAEREIWPALQHELAAGRACALLVVSEHRGSSPGRRGMLMAVGRHGPLAGTIGGGQAETTLVAAAQAALQAENLQPWRQTLIHHTTDSNASGMICAMYQGMLEQTTSTAISSRCTRLTAMPSGSKRFSNS